MQKKDGRKNGNGLGKYRIESENYNVKKEDNNTIGVYKIQLDNKIYIGSTIAGFRRRYTQHMRNDGGLMTHTQNLLKSGAIFEIVWKAMNNESEEQIRIMEQKYIDKYVANGFDIQNGRMEVAIPGKNKLLKKKNIKVAETDYEKAVYILNKNGIKIA